jgi:peptidyl-tRNA hydrolase
MGIGRPRVKEEVSSFVLSNFSKDESARAKILIKNLCDEFEKIIQKNPV